MAPTAMDLGAYAGNDSAPALPQAQHPDTARPDFSLSIGAREALMDLADLVASDPETATVEQTRQVAISLRGLLDRPEELS